MSPKRARIACQRCRALKHKCNVGYPRCSECAKKGIDCIIQDPITKELKSRESFSEVVEEPIMTTDKLLRKIEDLEKRVGLYESTLGKLGIKVDQDPKGAFNMSELALLSMIPFGGMTSTKQNEMIKSSIFGEYTDTSRMCIEPLPKTIQECDRILSNYIKSAWIQNPIIESKDLLFTLSQKHYVKHAEFSSWESFLIYISLAIGTAIVGELSTTSVRYYFTSIVFLKKFLASVPILLKNYTNDHLQINLRICSIQSLLLICCFGLLKPVAPGIWYIISSAMRLCIDLDLYEESVVSSLDGPNSDFHRRLFCSCYALDRQICCYANKPFTIDDLDITTRMVKVTGDNVPFDLFFGGRKVQSKIHQFTNQHVSKSNLTAEKWRQELHIELNKWVAKVIRTAKNPDPTISYEIRWSKDFLFLTYLQLAHELYRPAASSIRSITNQQYETLFDCAQKIISMYEGLARDNRINYKYLSAVSIYQSVLTYFYCLVHYPELSLRPNVLSDAEEFMQTVTAILATCKKECTPVVNIEKTISKIYSSSMDVVKKRLQSSVRSNRPLLSASETYGTPELDRELKGTGAIPLLEIDTTTFDTMTSANTSDFSAQILKVLDFDNIDLSHWGKRSAASHAEQAQVTRIGKRKAADLNRMRSGSYAGGATGATGVTGTTANTANTTTKRPKKELPPSNDVLWEFLYEEPLNLRDNFA